MSTKLSDDQRKALHEFSGGPIAVEDEQTRQRYVLVDRNLHERAMMALKQQQDVDAIRAGIADMEAGRVTAFEEVDRRIREKLGLPLQP